MLAAFRSKTSQVETKMSVHSWKAMSENCEEMWAKVMCCVKV